MQLDEVHVQCAAWQRKANNYRHIASNIMSKLSKYKQQIRALVLGQPAVPVPVPVSGPSRSASILLHNGLAVLDEDHSETFHVMSN